MYFNRSLLGISLSKDVSLNFYVHQTECKMEENTVNMHVKLHIIRLLQCFGGTGVGGGVSLTHCKTKTRVRTLVNHDEHRLSSEEIKGVP